MSRDETQAVLKEAFRKEFGNADISVGYQDLLFILVISKKFKGKNGEERLESMRNVIENCKLSEEEKNRVAGLYAYDPSEI